MSKQEDYLKYYYEYIDTETYYETDRDGNSHLRTRDVVRSGWTKNKNHYHNTGKVKLCHSRFYGYSVVKEGNKYKAIKSDAVDDIRSIIAEYPYFTEECVQEVSETFYLSKYEMRTLDVSDFNYFTGPDLTTKELHISDELKLNR